MGKATPVPGNPAILTIRVQNMTKGVYTVTWRTVSKVDGHLASGSFNFGVGVVPKAGTTAASGSSPPPSLQAVAGRWLFDAGLLVLIGAAFVGMLDTFVANDDDRDGTADTGRSDGRASSGASPTRPRVRSMGRHVYRHAGDHERGPLH